MEPALTLMISPPVTSKFRVVQSDGTITFAYTLANDLTTEGEETLEIKLFSDWARTTAGDTATVTINDTSLTPAESIFSIDGTNVRRHTAQVLITRKGNTSAVDLSVNTVNGTASRDPITPRSKTRPFALVRALKARNYPSRQKKTPLNRMRPSRSKFIHRRPRAVQHQSCHRHH